MRGARRLWLLSLLVLAACGEAQDSNTAAELARVATPRPDRAGEPALTERVAIETIQSAMAASGSIRARRVSEIGSEVSGRLTRVFVDVGDWVEQDAPLFRVDPRPYELALAEARAGLALARAESENAALEIDRVGKLVERRAASEQHFDQQRTAAAVALARVAQMEARVARAERDLGCTLVRAPYAGSIVERFGHEGAMVGPRAIVVLQETRALEAVLAIPDAWPASVRVGDQARLYVEGVPVALETRIDRVSDRVDPETHTYDVRSPVDDPSRALKAGSYVRAEIIVRSSELTPVVDRSALLMRDGRSYVFRVSGDTVERVSVRVGIVNRDRAQILGGLADGDEVVLGEAVGRLEDGARIDRAADFSSAQTRLGAIP